MSPVFWGHYCYCKTSMTKVLKTKSNFITSFEILNVSDLRILWSEKLSGDGHIFQVWQYWNHKSRWSYLFLSKNICKFPTLLSPSGTSMLHASFQFCVTDPKNIIYYLCDVQNYMGEVLNFLLLDKQEYTYAIFLSLILVSILSYRFILCNFFFAP